MISTFAAILAGWAVVVVEPAPKPAGTPAVGAAPDPPAPEAAATSSRSNWTLFPVLSVAPETSMMFSALAIYVVPDAAAEKANRPERSNLNFTIAYTLKNQFVLSVSPTFYLDDAKWRLNGALQAVLFPDTLYAPGPDSPATSAEKFSQRGVQLTASAERRVLGPLRVGAQSIGFQTSVTEQVPGGLLDQGLLVGSDGGNAVGAGPLIVVDNRDREFAARHGGRHTLSYIVFPNLGTDFALETAVGDVRAMVRALCQRLGVAQVDVVGFSFGGTLALLACADETLPVRSLTVIAPDVNLLAAERFAYAFALAEAERRGNKGARRALRAIGEPPHADAKRFMTRVKWIAAFGGVDRRKTFAGLLRTTVGRLWRSPHYNLREKLGALRGIEATTARMLPGLQGLDLLAKLPRVAVPIALFQGRHDKAAPPDLGAELAARLGADVIWFEESAHEPHEEEPARFRQELLRFVSSAGQGATSKVV